MRFKIDWASLIVGRKFTVLALFYFVFEGNFPGTSPLGAYIWRGELTEGFLRYRFGGLIFGGAYFRTFTVTDLSCLRCLTVKGRNTKKREMTVLFLLFDLTFMVFSGMFAS